MAKVKGVRPVMHPSCGWVWIPKTKRNYARAHCTHCKNKGTILDYEKEEHSKIVEKLRTKIETKTAKLDKAVKRAREIDICLEEQ